MLDVSQTGLQGVAVSVPRVIERPAIDYVALLASGAMQALPQFAPPKIAELAELMRRHGIPGGMPAFFRYRSFGADGSVELEVGTTVTKPVPAIDGLVHGLLPAGRYATATLFGPYDRLYDSFLMLHGWMEGRGLQSSGYEGDDGSHPECQMEVYRVGPVQTENPMRFETDLMLKLSD
jgi:hypothetical protein